MVDNIELEEDIVENDSPNENVKENDSFGIAGLAINELIKQNERLENAYKRQTGIIYVLLIMIVLAVGGFLWFLYQYDFATYDIYSEMGNANYIGNDGDIYNGTDSSEGAY